MTSLYMVLSSSFIWPKIVNLWVRSASSLFKLVTWDLNWVHSTFVVSLALYVLPILSKSFIMASRISLQIFLSLMVFVRHSLKSLFTLIVIHRRLTKKPVCLGIFCTNRDHTKPTLGWLIFAHLVQQPRISWTLILKPNSPGLGFGSTLVVKTYSVPRPISVVDNNPSSMV